MSRAARKKEPTWEEVFPPGARKPVPTRWTDGQQAFIDSPLHLTVLWGGNSIGKSVVLAELARRAIRGELHWQTPGQPATVILAGNTWTQVGSTLKYLWRGIDKGEFRAGVRYESGGIKGQRLQVFEVVGGKGKGGELRCGTSAPRTSPALAPTSCSPTSRCPRTCTPS